MTDKCLVSLVGNSNGWTKAAEKAMNWFQHYGWEVKFTNASKAEHFLSADDQEPSIEAYPLVLHIAHGSEIEFQVADTTKPAVGVRELALGKGNLRYLLLLSCRVLRHGPPNGQKPYCFKGLDHELDSNVFTRWGETGKGISPLGGGVRLVCGGSTFLNPTAGGLRPALRLIHEGFQIADAWILGLGSNGSTPLCTTLATDQSNPLYDAAWSNLRNVDGNKVFVQYPVRLGKDHEPIYGFGDVTEDPPATPGHGALAPIDVDFDPLSLPILDVMNDEEAQDLFNYMESSDALQSSFQMRHDRSMGTFMMRTKRHEVNSSSNNLEILTPLLEQAKRRSDYQASLFADSGLELEESRRQNISLQIDSFPVEAFSQIFPKEEIANREKCIFVLENLRFRHRESGMIFETLDPDVGTLLRLTKDLDGNWSENVTFRDLSLLTAGWYLDTLAERKVEAISARHALDFALSSLQSRIDAGYDSPETGSLERAEVSLGYRFYPSEEAGPGCLCPHYVVTIPGPEDGDGSPNTVIELPAWNSSHNP